jgi:hypothetical protein
MCHQDDSRKDCADQLVSLFAIYIAILSREGEGIVESYDCEIEIDAMFGAIGSILVFIPLKQHLYIQTSIYLSVSRIIASAQITPSNPGRKVVRHGDSV